MKQTEKQILDGYKSNLVIQAAAALAVEDFDRLDEIEASLACLGEPAGHDDDKPNTDAWDAVVAASKA